jgi:hypothetical protein
MADFVSSQKTSAPQNIVSSAPANDVLPGAVLS